MIDKCGKRGLPDMSVAVCQVFGGTIRFGGNPFDPAPGLKLRVRERAFSRHP